MKPVFVLLFVTLGVVSCARINLIFEDSPPRNDDVSNSDSAFNENSSEEETYVNSGFQRLAFKKQVKDGCDPNVCNSDCKKHDNGKTGRCISGECFCNDTLFFRM